MSLIERDKQSGYLTTGHEWNGIKELNTPVPRIVILCFIGTFLFSVGYWYMMPSWPLGDRFYPGKLGIDQRTTVTDKMAEADALKQEWINRLESADYRDIPYDDELMNLVDVSGARLFDDNCAVCHGRQGTGNLNYPSLADDSWLWGDDPEHIAQTLRVGINSDHPDARFAIMPAFGELGVLDKTTIENVVQYVRAEAKLPVLRAASDLKRQESGKQTFLSVCAGCHGQDLKGKQSIGTPNLVDRHWIYGDDTAQMVASIWSGRKGLMPSWEARLEPYERKILALYATTLD